MRYCQRCLYPRNHPLNIVIDDDGVCSGCRVHEEKDKLDWPERFGKLRRITEDYRSRSGDNYDCIVPVGGARDSHFIVHVVKNVLKLNPLLVQYNKHYNTRLGIRNLAHLRIAFDCDLIANVVSPDAVRALNRATLIERGSMYWHCLAGQTCFPVQCSLFHKIPLIIWGAHQGVDQVGMFSHLDEAEMTRKYRKEHDLLGLELDDIVKEHPELENHNLETFRYPWDNELQAVGVRGIYLNNYIRWDSKAQHELMIDLYGYETNSQSRTFDTYNDVDCFHYSGLHDYIKFLKFGYGKVTDHASREIRLKRMTRERGLEMVRRYNPVKPSDAGLFLEWMDMPEDELFELIDRHRDPRIWTLNGDRGWELADCVTSHACDTPEIGKARLTAGDECSFRVCNNREPDHPDDAYMIIGKGFVEGKQPSAPLNHHTEMPESSAVSSG